MKKSLLFFVLMVVVLISAATGCKKNSSPSGPTAATTIDSSALVTVPGGTYTQTDTDSNSFSHTISAFKMGKYQVTYDLWYTVYQWAIVNGYTFAHAGTEGYAGTAGAAPTTAKYQPVTTISWRDAIVWCNAYSQKANLAPVYCSNSGFTTAIKISTSSSTIDTTAGSVDNPYVNWSANGYRLPTEGEYQYAASYKDGTTWTPYNYASGATADYSDETATGLVAWYYANSGGVTHDVGGKTANALGIYDMSGNVFEWCWDWYGTYPTTASTNYTGPTSGSYRVIRGGSYVYDANSLQVGFRDGDIPYNTYDDNGFRFARTY
jgi:formylglycine-generating enzyme required for sulfatase activity